MLGVKTNDLAQFVMFYLTTLLAHFIYGNTISFLWLRMN